MTIPVPIIMALLRGILVQIVLVECLLGGYASASQPSVVISPDTEKNIGRRKMENVHREPVASAEIGRVLLKSDLYKPQRLELLKLIDAEVVAEEPTERSNPHKRRQHKQQHQRHGRQKRSANTSSGATLYTSGTMESTLHVLDVYPRDATLTFRMLSDQRLERLNVDNLDYGSHYERWSEISPSDRFNAIAKFEAGFKEVYEDQLATSAFDSNLPHVSPDELFVVLDGNSSLSLHASVFPYSKNKLTAPGRGSAYVYNALIPPSLGDPNDFDIVVYAPQHFKKALHPLLRLGNNIPLNTGAEILLPEGHYQLKVTHRGAIVNICDFQEVRSFIPPACIEITEHTHQYVVLHGIMDRYRQSSDYPPEMMMVPPNLCTPSEHHPRRVDIYFLNVYQTSENRFNHPVTFMFPNIYHSISLPPNSARFESLNLHDGDCFKVHTKGQTTDPPPIEVDAAESTMCIFLADNNKETNDMDAFQHCWAKYDYLAPAASWIFSYNALSKDFAPVDVLVLQANSDPLEEDSPSVLKIMHNVTTGEGMPAMLTAGTYIVKTFLASTVYTPEEFLATPSVAEMSVIDFKPRSYHFNILYGGEVATNGELKSIGRVLLEPPSPINATQFLIERARNKTRLVHSTTPPFHHSSAMSLHTGDGSGSIARMSIAVSILLTVVCHLLQALR